MKKFLLALVALVVTATTVLAQSAPNHALLIGRGAGVQGFRSVGPCLAGISIIGAGLSADPVCGTPSAITLANVKDPVRLATTAALAANTYANGASGVGATLTGNAVGSIGAIDGTTPSVAVRLLIKNEAAQGNNGCYVVTTVGSGGAAYVVTRCADSDTAAEMPSGASYLVTAGSANITTTWVNTV